MSNKPHIVIIAAFAISVFAACEKENVTTTSAPAAGITPTPLATPKCCAHRHFTSPTFWYYCCKCGILHAAGSGVGSDFYTDDVIAGAQVDYLDEYNTLVATVYTDEEGHWPQENIPDGVYTIVFTKSGYVTVQIDAVVMEDGETETDLTVPMEEE